MLEALRIGAFASVAMIAAGKDLQLHLASRHTFAYVGDNAGVRRASVGSMGAGITYEAIDGENDVGVRRVRGTPKRNPPTNVDLASEDHDLGGPQRRKEGTVMYGLVTNQKQRYRKKLETVMETWASIPRADGRFFAMAGRGYPSEWLDDGVVIAANCDDGPRGNACKEANLILEGKRRGASWVFIAGEDNYIDTRRVDKVLQLENSSVPVGLGCIGCSKGSTLYGDQIYAHGGFCGGCGEAISSAALKQLGSNSSALVEEYGQETQCDMSTSAAMRNRGIPLRDFPNMKNIHGSRFDTQKELETYAPEAMTLHYMIPPVMRWVHAMKHGKRGKDLAPFEEAAFKDGRVRGYNFQLDKPI